MGVIEAYTKTLSGTTAESLTPPTHFNARDILIQKSAGNTGDTFIGSEANCIFPLRGQAINLGDLNRSQSDEVLDLDRWFIRSTVATDTFEILMLGSN